MSHRTLMRYNHETGQVEEFTKPKVVSTGESFTCFGNTRVGTGIVSDALGVHPSQVKEFTEDAARHGFTGIEFNPQTGACKISDRGQRKRYMQHRGMYDRDAGYGDAAPQNF